MLGSGVRKNSIVSLLGAVVALLSLILAATISTSAQAQSTSVNAVICAPSSTITIDEPASDSVVTEPSIVLKGAIAQTGQIVIEVDGEYSGVEPIAAGQLNFETTMELARGTHTIKLTAVDSCGNANTNASIVVTYTPQPSTPSNGDTTPTGVGDGTQPQNGVTISGEAVDPVKTPSNAVPSGPVADAFNSVLEWLNIAPIDHSDHTEPRMTLLGAISIALGTYMATIGIATTVVSHVASLSWFDRYRKSERYKIVSRGFRIFGLVLILAGFFL